MREILEQLQAIAIANPLARIEILAVVILIALSLAFPEFSRRRFRAIERRWIRAGRHKRASILGVVLTALLLRAALLPLFPIRDAEVDDEQSYLVAADTFASGRVTNPPHPLWVHFETFHVNQQPTYHSMYHPVQGLILAFGQIVGHPWFGVWLSAALLCGCLTWMLQGWVPRQWALLGGIIAVFRIALFSYWGNSYWGGAHAAIGGALMFGAVPRLVAQPARRTSLLYGIGAALVVSSRPFEGAFFVVGLSCLLAWRMRKLGVSMHGLARIAAPVLAVGIITMLATGYYYWRTTGNPLQMPYQLNRNTYAVARHFLWQAPAESIVYRHEVFRAFYAEWEMQFYHNSRTAAGIVKLTLDRIVKLWMFFLGPLLTIPFLAALFAKNRWSVRISLTMMAVCFGAMCMIIWASNPHYAAPLTGAIYLVLIEGFRKLRGSRLTGDRAGLLLARGIPVVCILLAGLATASAAGSRSLMGYPFPFAWCCTLQGNTERARVLQYFKSQAGNHLVIVRYGPDHRPHDDWVYNHADIDRSRVVWARDMGAVKNDEIIRYYPDRKVWLVEPDIKPVVPAPYRGSHDEIPFQK